MPVNSHASRPQLHYNNSAVFMCAFYWIISLVSSTISASVLEYITLIRILLFIYCCYLKEVALSFPFGENGGGAHEFLFFLIHFLLPAILVLQLNNLRRRHSRLTAGHKHLAVSYRSFMLSLLSIHPVLSCTHNDFATSHTRLEVIHGLHLPLPSRSRSPYSFYLLCQREHHLGDFLYRHWLIWINRSYSWYLHSFAHIPSSD